MNGDDVRRSAIASLTALSGIVDRDWTASAGSLTWSCSETAAHVCHDLFAYAGQLIAQPSSAYLPFDLTVRAHASVVETLDILRVAAETLALAVDTSGPDIRAWHWGPTDVGGFAALGVTEILVHTWDIAQGLDLDWAPPAALSRAALDRLMPTGLSGDPAQLLLWSTGRLALDADHPALSEWTYHAALQN